MRWAGPSVDIALSSGSIFSNWFLLVGFVGGWEDESCCKVL